MVLRLIPTIWDHYKYIQLSLTFSAAVVSPVPYCATFIFNSLALFSCFFEQRRSYIHLRKCFHHHEFFDFKCILILCGKWLIINLEQMWPRASMPLHDNKTRITKIFQPLNYQLNCDWYPYLRCILHNEFWNPKFEVLKLFLAHPIHNLDFQYSCFRWHDHQIVGLGPEMDLYSGKIDNNDITKKMFLFMEKIILSTATVCQM